MCHFLSLLSTDLCPVCLMVFTVHGVASKVRGMNSTWTIYYGARQCFSIGDEGCTSETSLQWVGGPSWSEMTAV
jgi:hypothetical protein